MENHHERRKFCEQIELTSNWEAAETPLGLQVFCFSDSSLGREDNRIQDKTVLVTLDLPDHLSLVFWSAVVVDDTQATQKSHVNGHVVLGDSVHGRRQEGSLQCDTLGDRGVQRNIGSRKALP